MKRRTKLQTTGRCLAAGAAAALTLVLTAGTVKADVTVGTVKVVNPPPATSTTAPSTTAPSSAGTGTTTTTTKSTKRSQPVSKESTAAASKEAPQAKATKDAGPASGGATDGDSKDGGYTLKGGQDRTDFRSLTVEGEDRVHVEIERPPLALQLNPADVKGLDFGTARDVLDRTSPDLTTQYLAVSSTGSSPYTARPWLRQFASGAVARFQPAVRGTERWKLTVADSRGQNVAQFSGKGDAPREIVWDGRSVSGAPVTPGITYSYVFEAVDKAGNKRNFVGQGFRVSAYRLDSPQGPVLVFSGQSLQDGATASAYGRGATARPAPPIVLEAASTLNQSPKVSQQVRVNVAGRTYEQANATAKQVAAWLAELTIGDPARVQALAEVQPDAPEGGTVRIALADGYGSPSNAVPTMTTPKKEKSGKKKS